MAKLEREIIPILGRIYTSTENSQRPTDHWITELINGNWLVSQNYFNVVDEYYGPNVIISDLRIEFAGISHKHCFIL